MTGKEAYERYMTALAGVVKFSRMPIYDNLPPLAKTGWEAAADVAAPVHDEYLPAPVVEPPPVDPPADPVV